MSGDLYFFSGVIDFFFEIVSSRFDNGFESMGFDRFGTRGGQKQRGVNFFSTETHKSNLSRNGN